MIAEIQMRQPERDAITAAVEQYLNQGGKIEQLSHIERAPAKPSTWNGSISQRANSRRQYLTERKRITEQAKAHAEIGLTVVESARAIRKNWTGQAQVTTTLLEQLAAQAGFTFSGSSH